jgi:hypothetical protein
METEFALRHIHETETMIFRGSTLVPIITVIYKTDSTSFTSIEIPANKLTKLSEMITLKRDQPTICDHQTARAIWNALVDTGCWRRDTSPAILQDY